MKKKHRKLKIAGLILLAAVVAAVAYSLISSYLASLPKLQYEYYAGPPAAQSYPDASFAVISDIHFYDASLGSTGAAFEEALYSDRKLLLDGEDLLNYAVEELRASGVEFVLVSGDLTKDGERINHEKVSAYLQKLVDAGIEVFVTPGNHDINNPDAVRFAGDTTQSVESVSADEFAALYGNMGFNDALQRDDDSLSYVAEPKPGLWIVTLDACRYRENVPGAREIVSGKISQNTERWLSGVLSRSVEEGKAVIVLTHHGVVEHWKGECHGKCVNGIIH